VQNTQKQIKVRGSHAACLIPERNYMVVFGGQNATGLLNDLWILDLNEYVWIRPTVIGYGPSPRSGHTLVYDQDRRKIYLFGGYDGTKSK
jgi:hypothetical protein